MNWITNSVLPKIKAWVQSDDVPDNLWIKCPSCSQMIFNKDYEQQFNCCPGCNHHAPLRPQQRFALLFDNREFEPIAVANTPDDPLKFKDNKRYPERLKAARTKTGADDAIAIAAGTIGNKNAVVAAFDFQFMGGSMGRTVGDGLLRASEEAVARGASLIVVPSSGGARMQEGILSLMQLPRSIVAVERLKDAKLPYIVLLAHPTTGGVTASFAMLGDIQIAEPGAIIGFAGRRVIEETVREKLPNDFQTAEYLKEHGMVDMVVPRAEQHQKLSVILSLLMETRPEAGRVAG
jgi:acetyl-CoA carboxylase carboxyl transferase subunit beta